MSALAVVTPTFAGDFELFTQLHESVLTHTAQETVHYVIVPPGDRSLFDQFAGPRCTLWTASELLPRRYLHARYGQVWINIRRPWPPVRGWVLQQALKIAAAGMIQADAVLIVDSDVVMVRRADATRLVENGQLRLYRVQHAVHEGMERHVRWHQVARRLLGLPAAPAPPLHDYVSPLNVWDPTIVRAVQRRISEVTGRDWLDVFTSQLYISEFILYGVYVDEVLPESSTRPPSDTTFCHGYWDRAPLDHSAAMEFVDHMAPGAIGMMISAKSRTPLDVRQAAARRCAQQGSRLPEP